MAEGVSVGAVVGAGTVVSPPDGTAVGAAVVGADRTGVAVADEPQAKIAASRRAKDPKTKYLGFFNQYFKTD